MPYIAPDARSAFMKCAQYLGDRIITPGQLNYVISVIVLEYLGDSPRYKDFNEVIGVLECVKLELYSDRGPIGPYEEQKKNENGSLP